MLQSSKFCLFQNMLVQGNGTSSNRKSFHIKNLNSTGICFYYNQITVLQCLLFEFYATLVKYMYLLAWLIPKQWFSNQTSWSETHD